MALALECEWEPVGHSKNNKQKETEDFEKLLYAHADVKVFMAAERTEKLEKANLLERFSKLIKSPGQDQAPSSFLVMNIVRLGEGKASKKIDGWTFDKDGFPVVLDSKTFSGS